MLKIIPLENIEDITNKVTELNDLVTDDQYPSAKAVMDALDGWVKTNNGSDFIVEEGTSGMWTYRKWESGTMECWGTLTLTTTINAAWGSVFVGVNTMKRQNYPIAFTDKPVETVTLQAVGHAAWLFAESQGNGVNSKDASGIYNVCRPTAAADEQTFYLSFNVVGRWK